jgi:hypothetical protein
MSAPLFETYPIRFFSSPDRSGTYHFQPFFSMDLTPYRHPYLTPISLHSSFQTEHNHIYHFHSFFYGPTSPPTYPSFTHGQHSQPRIPSHPT